MKESLPNVYFMLTGTCLFFMKHNERGIEIDVKINNGTLSLSHVRKAQLNKSFDIA